MSQQQPELPLAAPTTRLVVRAALRTDVGRVRGENQDYGAYTTPEEERASTPGGRLLIVADGMGGHRGGATASRLAGDTVKSEYLESASHDIAEILRQALRTANATIFTQAQSHADLRGMGTTTSVLAVRNAEGWLAHVGDSRIYRVRGSALEQLTEDHSLVAAMVRQGLISAAEAETHPRRNILQRSMGVAEEVDIDVTGPFEVLEGDVFILCSDGLHGVVKSAEMAEVAQLPIDRAADEFVARTLDRGAPDNVTVIVARVERETIPPEEIDPLEETQPLGAAALDFDHLEQTVIDGDPRATPTQPIQAVPPEPVVPAASSVPDVDPHEAPTQPVPALRDQVMDPDEAPTQRLTVAPPPSSMSVVVWIVALALLAGAAWYFWSR